MPAHAARGIPWVSPPPPYYAFSFGPHHFRWPFLPMSLPVAISSHVTSGGHFFPCHFRWPFLPGVNLVQTWFCEGEPLFGIALGVKRKPLALAPSRLHLEMEIFGTQSLSSALSGATRAGTRVRQVSTQVCARNPKFKR